MCEGQCVPLTRGIQQVLLCANGCVWIKGFDVRIPAHMLSCPSYQWFFLWGKLLWKICGMWWKAPRRFLLRNVSIRFVWLTCVYCEKYGGGGLCCHLPLTYLYLWNDSVWVLLEDGIVVVSWRRPWWLSMDKMCVPTAPSSLIRNTKPRTNAHAAKLAFSGSVLIRLSAGVR